MTALQGVYNGGTAAEQAAFQASVSTGLVTARQALVAEANIARSTGRAFVDYSDNPATSEQFASLSAWAVGANGLQVSGGRVYAPTSGAGAGSNANYSFALTASENCRFLTDISIATSTNVIVGFSTDAAGAVPAAGGASAYGLYFRWNGGTVQSMAAGTAADVSTATIATGDVYQVSAVADTWYLTFSAVKRDGTKTFRYRTARAGKTVGNLHIHSSNTSGLSGGSIGPVYARKQFGSMPRSNGGEAGMPSGLTEYWTGDGTNNATLWLPRNYDSRNPCPVVIVCHPYGSSDVGFWADHNNGQPIRNALCAAGFAVIGACYNSNLTTWGAEASLNSYLLAYKLFRDRFALGSVCLLGVSMGGFESLLLHTRGVIKGAIAWAGIVPGFSLSAAYADTVNGFQAAINTAYNISGDYPQKTAGYDVALRPASDFQRIPSFVAHATDDSVLPTALHATPLLNRLTEAGCPTTVVTFTGGHSSASIGAQAAAVVAHFQSALDI